MKKIFTFILLISTLNIFSQTLSMEKVNFYNCDVTKSLINTTFDNWILEQPYLKLVFKDSSQIKLRFEDEAVYTEKKKLRPFGFYKFDITLFAKNGKLKVKVDNFQHTSESQYICAGGNLESPTPNCSSDLLSPVMWNEFQVLSSDKSKEILELLEIYLLEELGTPNQF